MRYLLRDRNPGMVQAWAEYFKDAPNVSISCGDIFGILDNEKVDAIVSPANSFGFMDGGIDLAYSEFFGWQLQERLQSLLAKEHDGELPVGEAVIIHTDDSAYKHPPDPEPKIPLMISAPTMRVPLNIQGTVNAYLAFRAVIRAVKKWNLEAANAKHSIQIDTVLCPGLGTAVGKMPFNVSAFQMYQAWRISDHGFGYRFNDLGAAWSMHDFLRTGTAMVK